MGYRRGLPPGSHNVTELIACQEGAIVSRTLLHRSAGTVTLFAFAEGEQLSEHTAPYDALFFVVEGEAEVTVAGESHHLPAGHLILLPAQVPHAVRALSDCKALLVMIRED